MSTQPMATEYTNRFGRRQTRGIRPWLLIPKVIAVAAHFGGMVALLALWIATPDQGLIDVTRRLVLIVVVPALLLAMLLGVALLLQHPRTFLRMRWLQVKLIIAAIYVPAAHLFMSSRLALIRASADASAITQFRWGLAASVATVIVLIVLARLKPRLGQNWARSYSATTSATPNPPRA